jgi:hypothetical protein
MHTFGLDVLKETDNPEDTRVDKTIILKLMLWKHNMKCGIDPCVSVRGRVTDT